MAKSLLEQPPSIVASGERQATQILDVAHEIAGKLPTQLVELQESKTAASAEVQHRKLSDATISVRASSKVDLNKRIRLKLPIPIKDGGLKRTFIVWAEDDSTIGALANVLEYRSDILCRPYLKADGMSAQYSPDFLARAAEDIHVVETEALSARSENAQNKQRVAAICCEQIKQFPEEQRDGREWHHVLLGETIVKEWKSTKARASELLEYARPRRNSTARQERLL